MGAVYLVKVEIAPEAERAWDAWNTDGAGRAESVAGTSGRGLGR